VPTSLAPAARVGFDALRANPLRTLLSTLGIIMGVASLVAVLALGDGLERFARDQIGGTTDLHAVSVSPLRVRTVDGTPVPVADPVAFTAGDAAALAARLAAPTDSAGRPAAPLRALVGRVLSGVTFTRAARDTAPRAVQLTGADAALLGAQGARVVAGRRYTAAETAAGAPVALATQRLLADLGAPGRPLGVGDTIRLGGAEAFAAGGPAGAGAATLRLQVVGVLGDERAGPRERAVVVPPDVAARAAARISFGPPGDALPSLLAVAERVEDAPAVRGAAERWSAERWGRDRVRVGSRADRVDQARQGLLVFKLVMGAITGVSLLVGGVGVMNVLLASVAERTREIGVRRALGATRRDVLVQFLAEAVAIAGVGSVAGTLLGVTGAFGATAAVRAYSKAQVHAWLTPSSVLVAVGVTVLVGLVFGLYPARRAAGLSPIDAIRHET
jgi:putative ABC transport system permease protein